MTDKLPDFSMDKDNLYREELYTDHRAGTLRKMIPVQEDGTLDPTRATYFVGETQVMTPMGALPVSFEIQTDSLSEAVSKFGELAEKSLKETIEKIKELQRQQASSIVVPGQGNVPPISGGPAGTPGGGIQLP